MSGQGYRLVIVQSMGIRLRGHNRELHGHPRFLSGSIRVIPNTYLRMQLASIKGRES